MAKFRQFYLLLWKNWTLGKRSPWRTVFEIFLPLFFILILVLLRALKIKDVPEPKTLYKPFTISSLPKGLDGSKLMLAYAPNTTEVTKVIDDVTNTLKFNGIRGFESEADMVDFLRNEGDMKSKYLGGIVFLTTPDKADISYKIRLSSRSRSSKNDKKKMLGGGASTAWQTQFTFNVFQLPGPRNKNSSHGGPPDYYGEGFLAIQNAVDGAILRYKNVSFPVEVIMHRFPYPDYIKDNFILVIQQTLPLLLMLSLTVTALYITRDIVVEKERKLKESMKMMGLSGWLHWLAWFTKFFLFLLITVVFGSALFTIKFSSNGKVLNKSDPSLIFLFLLLYIISSIMFCFMVSVFFKKASIATAGGGIIWFFSYMPYYFVSQSYDTMSLGVKLATCLISNCNMAIGSMLIGKFEGQGSGVQWSNLYKGVSVDDSMTLGYVFLMFIADSFLYGAITWYVEAVFPGEYGTPQPWYFPFLKSYWCGRKQVDPDKLLQNGIITTEFHEKEPAALHAGVKVKNISKTFSTDKGQKVAVDRVSLNMYEGQITVLLGHNGAGKTTLMSMLTGLFPPSSGSAFVNDCDITNDMAGVRSSLGLCPQHDVLFDLLTVEEHLWFFAMMKGCPKKRVSAEIDHMIQSIGLQDKRCVQTRALSGGMKRKLSVGIALIAGSKVVMLDEPTSGMDPSARRFTWDLLQQQRQGRTMLLTTHFMDEADLLGDRIAIMAEGQIKCCGSSLFLKNKFGVGYHMAVVKATNCNVPMVTKVVQQYVPAAQLESNVGAELTYILPSESTGKFEQLFNELESRREDLGINSFGVSVTTMEEVFLKVGEEMDDSLSKTLQQDDSDSNSRDIEEDDYRIDVDDTNKLGVFSGASLSCQTSTHQNCKFQLAWQRWYAMFVKRLLHSRRHKLSIISQLVLPLAFTLIALIQAKTFPQPGDSPALSLNATSFGQNYVPYTVTSPNSTKKLTSAFLSQFIGTNTAPVRVKRNMSNYLINHATEIGLGAFNLHYLVAASLEQVKQSARVVAWFNNQAFHAVAITLATVQNGILKSALGSNHSLTTINHPLPRTTKDTIDDLRRNGLGFMLSFNILFGMAFLASSFVVFLVQERSNKAKHVQFVSGVDPLSYWTSAYAWDLINYIFPAVSLIILLAAFEVPAYSGKNLGYAFLLLMVYGWAIIPVMYLFSFLFTTAATAFVILTTFNIITGLATLMTVFILSIPDLDLLDVANVLKWVFLVLPNYCLGQGLGDIFNNYDTLYYFNEAVDFCMKEPPFPEKRSFCENLVREIAGKQGDVLEFQENYLAWDNPGIGRYLIFMAWEGLFFFCVVLVIEFGLLRRFVLWLKSCSLAPKTLNYGEPSGSMTELDDDVYEEKRRIATSIHDQDVLVIRELTKVFPGRRGRGPLLAVDSLSLGVPMGECFGLLGVNGAGKTTTFRMLTGDEIMTSGTATVDAFDIRSNMRQVRQRIGYCPQFDALIGHMTVREMLYMFARLRGVPESNIKQTVNDLIRSLLLSNHADKLTKSLSGGNKRKLSTAISLVGEPPVVFLDEPTTGMDPVAKRLLWNALCRVRADGRCIVITSHSMEECDALCTRIAIMVNGRLKCLGSPQHLKTKFGEGYTLIAKVGGIDTTQLKEYIEETFPGSVLKDEHLGMVHYHITDTSVSWAQIFGAVERVKMDYNIEDYNISQTTLDQVFLNFARGQRIEDD